MATRERALRRESPSSHEEVAQLLHDLAEEGAAVRPVGAGTKLGWGAAGADPDCELSTGRLDRIVEHNEGDLTAILEAGVPLARAQEAFAEAGQMLALDPPLGDGERATMGGIAATGDSGPLRHRYGAPRDQLLGATLALPDGKLAHSGGKVIKNVAGYDLAKLFTGSFGTLGVVVEVAVRLQPLSPGTATAVASSADTAALAGAASALAHSPLEMQSLDVRWEEGAGRVLARFGGATAEDQAAAACRLAAAGGAEAETVADDAALWAAQRDGQRSDGGAVVRVSGVQTELPSVLRAADRAGARLVGRAALGVSWIALPQAGAEELAAAIDGLRAELAPLPCVVLDAPPEVRSRIDVWGEQEPGTVALARRVKERFDPQGILNPGVFVGGI